MKLKNIKRKSQLSEFGGYITLKPPSVSKKKVKSSTYGDQSLFTFNVKDQDSAMQFWSSLLKGKK